MSFFFLLSSLFSLLFFFSCLSSFSLLKVAAFEQLAAAYTHYFDVTPKRTERVRVRESDVGRRCQLLESVCIDTREIRGVLVFPSTLLSAVDTSTVNGEINWLEVLPLCGIPSYKKDFADRNSDIVSLVRDIFSAYFPLAGLLNSSSGSGGGGVASEIKNNTIAASHGRVTIALHGPPTTHDKKPPSCFSKNVASEIKNNTISSSPGRVPIVLHDPRDTRHGDTRLRDTQPCDAQVSASEVIKTKLRHEQNEAHVFFQQNADRSLMESGKKLTAESFSVYGACNTQYELSPLFFTSPAASASSSSSSSTSSVSSGEDSPSDSSQSSSESTDWDLEEEDLEIFYEKKDFLNILTTLKADKKDDEKKNGKTKKYVGKKKKGKK